MQVHQKWVTDSIFKKYLNQARGIIFAWNKKDTALVILLYYNMLIQQNELLEGRVIY